ncbi:MAG TPA: hypothetical protein VLX68_11290 [Chitinivibrionales bacterium]|nr:hypothetical protein [Chitinivibrionales bacterium]
MSIFQLPGAFDDLPEKIVLSAPDISERQAGQFTITTNHPDKPEIKLNGAIEK